MIQELEGRGCFPAQVQLRKARLASNYSKILKSPHLNNLFTQLDEWPSTFRSVEVKGGLKHVQLQIEKALKKQIDRLHAAVDDAGFDRHELRILVKRTRYLTEAFPTLSPLSRKAASSLKALQSALGSWHDHYQWCQKALIEPDLRPLERAWQSSATTALEKAEIQLVDLAKLLPKSSGKKRPPNSGGRKSS
jgi:CHAD domain-containing protein